MLAVVIVTYNFEPWLTRCMESLRKQTLAAHEGEMMTVVVDNASTDGTVQRLRDEYPEAHLILNKENLGFGAANNQGIRWALQQGAEDVFLLNEDAWLEPETLEVLRDLAAQHPEAGILSPIHLDGTGTALDEGFAKYSPQPPEGGFWPKRGCGTESPLQGVGGYFPFVNAAFWYLPARTLQRVGLFSPLFYHYGEDRDYVNRLLHHGLKILVSTKVHGCHDRAHRPMSRAKYFRIEYTYHLSVYADVQRTFGNAFLYAVPAAAKKAFQALRHGRFRDAASYLSITCRLITKTPAVLQHRHRFK